MRHLDSLNLSGGWILLAKGKVLTHVDFSNFELKTFREMCFLFALKTFWEILLASVFMAFQLKKLLSTECKLD